MAPQTPEGAAGADQHPVRATADRLSQDRENRQFSVVLAVVAEHDREPGVRVLLDAVPWSSMSGRFIGHTPWYHS